MAECGVVPVAAVEPVFLAGTHSTIDGPRLQQEEKQRSKNKNPTHHAACKDQFQLKHMQSVDLTADVFENIYYYGVYINKQKYQKESR